MLVWALVNTLLTVLALAFALLNAGSPHRLRFHICMLALLCWLVPWSQVGGWMPDLLSLDLWQVEQRMIATSADLSQIPLILIDTSTVPLANPVTLLHLPLLVLGALLASGCALYGWSVLQHHLLLRSLQRTARDASQLLQQSGIDSSVPVLLQDHIAGAFYSGVFKPVIWVHSELAASPELPTLLRHELTHIQQNDNAWLLSITLVEKLFWWNPLVSYLGQQTRHLQELSCDERCRATNADYAAELAQLMLGNLGLSRCTATLAPESLLLSANIFNKPAINIQRLKLLQRSHQMKPRHIVSAVATAALAVATIGLVTAQPEANAVFVSEEATFTAAVPGQAGGPPQLTMGLLSLDGVNDQFVKIDRINDEDAISFSFTDAELPLALGPLAQLLSGLPAVADLAIGAGGAAPPAGERRIVMRSRALPADGTMQTMPLGAEQIAELEKLRAEQGLPTPPAGAVVRRFAMGAGAPGAPLMSMPFADKLVLETEEAKTRRVSVQGENLTFDEAIEAIAKASNCNIFKDGDTIVVDWCGAQQ